MQDIRSPLYVLLATAVVNFVGNMALVLLGGLMRQGLLGVAVVAWVTGANQYITLLFFGRWWFTAPMPKDAACGKEERLDY